MTGLRVHLGGLLLRVPTPAACPSFCCSCVFLMGLPLLTAASLCLQLDSPRKGPAGGGGSGAVMREEGARGPGAVAAESAAELALQAAVQEEQRQALEDSQDRERRQLAAQQEGQKVALQAKQSEERVANDRVPGGKKQKMEEEGPFWQDELASKQEEVRGRLARHTAAQEAALPTMRCTHTEVCDQPLVRSHSMPSVWSQGWQAEALGGAEGSDSDPVAAFTMADVDLAFPESYEDIFSPKDPPSATTSGLATSSDSKGQDAPMEDALPDPARQYGAASVSACPNVVTPLAANRSARSSSPSCSVCCCLAYACSPISGSVGAEAALLRCSISLLYHPYLLDLFLVLLSLSASRPRAPPSRPSRRPTPALPLALRRRACPPAVRPPSSPLPARATPPAQGPAPPPLPRPSLVRPAPAPRPLPICLHHTARSRINISALFVSAAPGVNPPPSLVQAPMVAASSGALPLLPVLLLVAAQGPRCLRNRSGTARSCATRRRRRPAGERLL